VLAGKVAIVSGVGTGLGRSIALALAREGAAVALAARTESMLESVATEVEQMGAEAWWQRFDISDPDAAPSFVEGVNARFGRIDILVNNGHHKGDFLPLALTDVDSWPDIFAVNTFGPMRLIQQVLPVMRGVGGGSVVNVNCSSAHADAGGDRGRCVVSRL